MRAMRHRRLAFVFMGIAFVACGSRTALLVTEPVDGGIDAAPDVRDASRDRRDVTMIEEDALPPIDTSKPDVPPPNDCPDADATLVYLISQQNTLMSFYPPTFQFKTIGKIACPNTMSATPFSMGVDRKGTAFIIFTNGNLYRVSTLTAACVATSFKPTPMSGFFEFGMGFAGDNLGDELYVAGSPQNGSTSAGLATIDTQMTFNFSFINPFSPALGRTEMTGTGDGRLFGWSPDNSGGSTLTQIDRKTANLIGANKLTVGNTSDAFAFAFWGGDFYIFTGQTSTTVTMYDPTAKKETNVAATSELIVGAGVSTCAPSQ
jgi:hypothetical protein